MKKLFAYNLTRIRESKGLTITKLANLSNIARQTIYHYENGERLPDLELFSIICIALEVNYSDFFLDKNGEQKYFK